MNLFISFKTIGLAMLEMLLISGLGYFIMKRKVISRETCQGLSRLVIDVSLPLFLFHKLINSFDFKLYSNWYVFPLMSVAITLSGLFLGYILIKIFKVDHKREFLSLVAFQNSGYIPIALVSVLLPDYMAQVMFVYIALFLLGFNLIIWSFGMCMLSVTCQMSDKNNFKNLFNPPVIATLAALICIIFGINKMLPAVLLNPIKALGDTTVPLSLLVLGANLCEINFKNAVNRESMLAVAAKLFLMPIAALIFLKFVPLPKLMGMLLLLQAAVPSANSLAVISRRYGLEDNLISGTILLSSLFCIVTLPLFLFIFDLL